MSFSQLVCVCRLRSPDTEYFSLVDDWARKRRLLALQLKDIPTLIEAYKTRASRPYPGNPRITEVDTIPELRLANACEASAEQLYSLAEIATQFGNKVSKGLLPASFNDLRKKAEKNTLETGLSEMLGDLQWYRKVREIRTEWTHYSSILIGSQPNGEPLLVVQANRRVSDLKEFEKKITSGVDEFTGWIQSAIHTTDQFADYLLGRFVLMSLDWSATFTVPRYDEKGVPIILPGDKVDIEKITVREHLRRCGVAIPPSSRASG